MCWDLFEEPSVLCCPLVLFVFAGRQRPVNDTANKEIVEIMPLIMIYKRK